MTSFECYNMRVANPKAYFIFCDNFLKIEAGQTSWKDNLEDGVEGHFKAFAAPAVEALMHHARKQMKALVNNKSELSSLLRCKI
jgi:hypothetical protein